MRRLCALFVRRFSSTAITVGRKQTTLVIGLTMGISTVSIGFT
jgi:hypothetical protein